MMHLSPWERRALVGAALFALFTLSASALFLWGTGQLADYPAPFAQWWLFLPDADDPDVRFWLLASGLPAAALTGFAAAAWFWRKDPGRIDGLAGGVLLFGGFTVLSSLLFEVITAAKDLIQTHSVMPAPTLWMAQWWLWLPYTGDPDVRARLLLSGVPAAAAVTIAVVALYRRLRHKTGGLGGWSLRRNPPATQKAPAPIRGTTDNFGHAHWMPMARASELWPDPDPAYGGIVVGEAYNPREDTVADIPFNPADPQTWGVGGKAPLLIDPCRDGPTHSLVISGPGGYKTTGSAIPTLLTWTGAAVVLDPSAELGPMLAEARRGMGHRVVVLSPNTAREIGFNALDWIDINSPMAETDVRAVVEWICGDTPVNDASAAFFRGRGKALVTCLLAHILWAGDIDPDMRTLRTLRRMIVKPEDDLKVFLAAIHRSSPSRLAQDLAGTLMGLADETFSGAYANADECTDWLSNRAYTGLVSGDSFRSSDITQGNLTVFIALPLKALQATPAAARTIVGALLNAAYEADGNVRGRVLFLLDEVARLGPMSILATARDAGRKYGITLHLIYQSAAQITEQWGAQGRGAWYEAATWRAYAAIKDVETARELSATIGDYGVLGWSEAENTAMHRKPLEIGSRSTGSTWNYQETGRALMKPEEIMHDLREDVAIVIPKKGRPLLCGRAIYFRRPEMASKVAVNRFATRKEPTNA
jgi:type IV secretion system protein VirD4